MRGVAKAYRRGVVAWLPDDLAGKGLRNRKDEPEPSASVWLKVMWNDGEEILPGADSTVLRPREGGTNVDRALVGPLARTIDRLGYLPLDDAAEYALAIGARSREPDPLARVLFENALPGAFQLMFRADWSALALWGGFTRPQRAAMLATNAAIPWADVPKPQRDRIVQAILSAGQNEFRQNAPSLSALANEPTEALANEIALGRPVTGMGRVSEGVFAMSTDDNPYNGGLATPLSLANAVLTREREPDVIHYDGLPKVLPSAFVPGRTIGFGFTVALSPTLTWTKYGDWGEVDLRVPPRALESLPLAFLSDYRKALESLRRVNRP